MVRAKNSSPKKAISRLIAAVFLMAGAGFLTYKVLVWRLGAPVKNQPAATNTVKTKPHDSGERTLTFSAAGDFLAHDSVVKQAKTNNGYDFSPYFTSVKSLYGGSDVFFCNPETPSAGAAYGISGYPAFNAPVELARDMSKTGCNLINLATNHMADKGQAAINATIDQWQKLPVLAVTGANRNASEQKKVKYFEKNGIKTAFLAFADFSNVRLPNAYSINTYHDEALVRQLMSEARQHADAVIVSAHWGTEDSHTVTADQQKFAKLFADLGADVVIGTGPHMIQKADMLDRAGGGKTLVWYSIGNFLSSQLQVDELTGGVAQFKLVKTDKGISISDVKFRPTFMSYEWSPADRQAQNLLARRNLKLQPLKQAANETKLHGTTVEERLAKVRQWLAGTAKVAVE